MRRALRIDILATFNVRTLLGYEERARSEEEFGAFGASAPKYLGDGHKRGNEMSGNAATTRSR